MIYFRRNHRIVIRAHVMPGEILPTDENLSSKQLAWGEWWLTHKHQVKTVATVIFGVVGVAMLLYGAWGFLDWYFGSGVRERESQRVLSSNLIDYQSIRERTAPSDLKTEGVDVINAGEGKYDLYTTVTNGNTDWWADFTYEFKGDGMDGKTFRGMVLPSEKRALRRLAYASGRRPSSVQVEITDLRWHRIDHHAIQPDFATWAKERLDVRFSDVAFTPAAADDPLGVGKASFTAFNATGWGYHSLTFFVALYSGSRIVGVNQVIASDFFAGEHRKMEVAWFNELPNVTRVEITPEANLLDDNTYIAPKN